MSNNNPRKNRVYAQTMLNALPYSSPRAVQYANDTTITAGRLNNTFAQLVDNDKVVEYQLARLSSYSVGPKTYDEQAIYFGRDGYKAWKNDDDDQLSILHKIDRSLQESVISVDAVRSDSRFVVRAAERMFAGASDGLFMSEDGAEFSLFSAGDFYAAHSDSYGTFFASSTGLYQLNSENYDVETETGTVVRTRYFVSRRNRQDLAGCRSVYVRNDIQRIYVGTVDGVYVGTMTKNRTSADMDFEPLDMLSGDVPVRVQVNALQELAHNSGVLDNTMDMVAATDAGIYQSHEMNGVIGKGVVLPETDIKQVVQFAGKIYAVTAEGLYDVAAAVMVAPFMGAKCCVACGMSLFVGGPDAVLKYSPYEQLGSVEEIPVPGAEVEQLFLVRPSDPESGTVADVILGRRSDGRMFTIDVKTGGVNVDYDLPPGHVSTLYAGSRNKLYASCAETSSSLSVFDVGSFYVDTLSSYGRLSAYSLAGVGLVAYVMPPSEDRALDKMVYATAAAVTDPKNGNTMTGSGITAFKAMVSPDGGSEYGVIDGGVLKCLTGQLVNAGGNVSASDFTDTARLVVACSDGHIVYAQKSNLYGGYEDVGKAFEAPPTHMQSDGTNVYFLVGDALSTAVENPVLVMSDTLSDQTIYDVKSSDEFGQMFVVTDHGIEFHQLSSSGYERPIDIVSSFAGTVHRCEQTGNIVQAYCDGGISSFQLSVGPGGVVQVSAVDDPSYGVYSSYNLYDRKAFALRDEYEFLAAEDGLWAAHNEYKKIAEVGGIARGGVFAEGMYFLTTAGGISFYRGSAAELACGVVPSSVASYVSDESISAYFGGESGLSAVVLELGDDATYRYSGGVVKVSDADSRLLSPIVEVGETSCECRGMLVSDGEYVYELSDMSSPICLFENVAAVCNFRDADGTVRVFVSDGGVLCECTIDPDGGETYRTYGGISEVDEIAVDVRGSSSQPGQFSLVADLFVRCGGRVYRLDVRSLSEESTLGEPTLTGASALRSVQSEPHRVQAFTSDGGVYEVGQSGVFGKVFGAGEPVTMYSQIGHYATSDSVFARERCVSKIDGRKCVQLSVASGEVSGTCYALFSDGKLQPVDVLSGYNLSDLRPGEPILTGVRSITGYDGAVQAVYLDNTYSPDIGSMAARYDFSSYGVSINCTIHSNSVTRQLFGTPVKSLMFATSRGVYRTDLDRAELAVKNVFNITGASTGFSMIKRVGGEIFAVRGNQLLRTVGTSIRTVGTYSGQVEDVDKSGSVVYVKIGGQWYSDRNGIECLESQFDGYDVICMLTGRDSSGTEFGYGASNILVATRTGLYTSAKSKCIKLIVQAGSKLRVRDFSFGVARIFGHADGSSDSVNVVLSAAGGYRYYAYDYATNEIREDIIKVAMSNGQMSLPSETAYRSLFNGVFPVNGDVGSGQTFAAVGSATDLYETKSEYLTPYDDIRITRSDDITINSVAGVGNRTYVCTTKGAFVSQGRGRQLYFEYVADGAYSFTGSVEVNRTRYLFSSGSGMFTLVNKGRPLSKSVYKNEARNTAVPFVYKYEIDGSDPTYAYAEGCSVLTSDNAKKFEPFLTVGSPGSSLSVRGMYALNRNEYYFATSDGLYRTKYTFDLSNDIQKFTVRDAKDVYDSMQDELSARYERYLGDHITADHTAGSIVTYLNERMLSVSFDDVKSSDWNVKRFSALSDEMYVVNDIVYEMRYGDAGDGDIYVNTSNFLTSVANADCSYILKRYMSGVSELYVYVPTTNSYYINHVEGDPGCTKYAEAVKRQNLAGFTQGAFKTDMTKQYSQFEVGIDSTFLSIDTLLGVQVNGNSLPLKVYRDTTYAASENDACLMYHSFVQPSRMMTPMASVQVDTEGEYKMRFACFGSDAQAVKITFYDSMNGTGLNAYKVVFHANGADGSMASQRFTIGQAKKLRRCSFTWPSGAEKMFNGWTTVVDPDESAEAMYADQAEFVRDESQVQAGEEVHLYAIWLSYKFSEGDTTLMLGSTSEEFFIDGADIITDTKLGDKVVIDYGD